VFSHWPEKIISKQYMTDWLTAKLLLALNSTVILGSKSHGSNNHTYCYDSSGSLHASETVHALEKVICFLLPWCNNIVTCIIIFCCQFVMQLVAQSIVLSFLWNC
jgi:hypothetical protein